MPAPGSLPVAACGAGPPKPGIWKPELVPVPVLLLLPEPVPDRAPVTILGRSGTPGRPGSEGSPVRVPGLGAPVPTVRGAKPLLAGIGAFGPGPMVRGLEPTEPGLRLLGLISVLPALGAASAVLAPGSGLIPGRGLTEFGGGSLTSVLPDGEKANDGKLIAGSKSKSKV